VDDMKDRGSRKSRGAAKTTAKKKSDDINGEEV